MMNVLLFIHVVIAVLLIIVILLQRSSADGISSMGGGGGMGVVSDKTVNSFLTKTTITLAALFLVNALVLANLSSRKNSGITEKIDQTSDKSDEVPMAK